MYPKEEACLRNPFHELNAQIYCTREHIYWQHILFFTKVAGTGSDNFIHFFLLFSQTLV